MKTCDGKNIQKSLLKIPVKNWNILTNTLYNQLVCIYIIQVLVMMVVIAGYTLKIFLDTP